MLIVLCVYQPNIKSLLKSTVSVICMMCLFKFLNVPKVSVLLNNFLQLNSDRGYIHPTGDERLGSLWYYVKLWF